jgi:hypothetical protein
MGPQGGPEIVLERGIVSVQRGLTRSDPNMNDRRCLAFCKAGLQQRYRRSRCNRGTTTFVTMPVRPARRLLIAAWMLVIVLREVRVAEVMIVLCQRDGIIDIGG